MPESDVHPVREVDDLNATVIVKRTSPDTENHEQNGYAKVFNDKYTFKTNVDNDNSDTTYTDMRNMQN